MRWFYVIILIVAILLVLGVTGYGMGYHEAIAAGFDDPVTPDDTYVAGVNLGGLGRDALEAELERIGEEESTEELVVWISDTEHFSISFNNLDFHLNPVVIADEIFELFPPGMGIRDIAKRRSTLRNGLRIPVKLDLNENDLRRFLTETKSQVDQEVRNASLDFENRTIAEAKPGRIVDIDATIARVPTSINGLGSISILASLDEQPPKVTSVDFEGIDPIEPLGSFKTKFNPYKRGRSFNIGHLAEKFKGVTLKPGEQISFNKISGPRDEATGFKPAPEYIEHRIIIGFGGGSCQVSTTLYNAALLAGMQIDERAPHSRVVQYVPYGRDATVNYDSRVDLKFTNTLDHTVVIWPRYDVKAGWLEFDIFGNPDDRRNIEITNAYTRIWRDISKDQFIVDKSLAQGEEVEDDGGTNGIKVQTWRHFIQPDGSRVTEKLFYDVIMPVSRVVRHNPATGKMQVESKTTSEQKALEETGYVEVYF